MRNSELWKKIKIEITQWILIGIGQHVILHFLTIHKKGFVMFFHSFVLVFND